MPIRKIMEYLASEELTDKARRLIHRRTGEEMPAKHMNPNDEKDHMTYMKARVKQGPIWGWGYVGEDQEDASKKEVK